MGEENQNSEKLLSFCTSHKLLVGGTWFQHRQVHRYTYNPPDPSCRKKMLDHILFAERYRGCLTNVRTRRGKTTITDHELVIAEVSMKLLSKKPCFTPRISSAKLQDETRVTYSRRRSSYILIRAAISRIQSSLGTIFEKP